MSAPPPPRPVVHHGWCNADYPEKVPDEAPQELTLVDLSDIHPGCRAWVCVDCGATVNDLPED